VTLLNRILQEKRTLVTFVTMILALDVGLFAFAVYPWSRKVSQAETRAAADEARLGQARASYASASEASSNKLVANNELQRFYDEVLPADLAAAREISAPFLVQLAEDTNLVLERRSSAPDKERESLLARLRTTMELAGAYEDIRRFIFELETAPEFILIEEVILRQGDASNEELVLTLGVSTYYWAGPDAAS
jgi:Tfp pilus assembly protein PilO